MARNHMVSILLTIENVSEKGQLFALEEKPLESIVNHAGQVKKRNVTYKCCFGCRMQEWRRKTASVISPAVK